MNRASLELLARQWRRYRTLREVGLVTAAASVAAGLVFPVHPFVAAVLGVASAAVTGFALRRRSLPITVSAIAEHLNRRCPALEESAALWLRDPEDLDLVERLQLRRLNQSWDSQPSPQPGSPPHRRLLTILSATVLSAAFLGAVIVTTSSHSARRASVPQLPRSPAPASTPLLSAALEIFPPTYLGQSSRRIDSLSAEVEDGSEVRWSFVTSPHIAGLELSSNGTNDSLIAQPLGKGRFQFHRVIVDNFVYQISVRRLDGSKVTLPTLHVLQVRRDTPPRLTWRSPTVSRTSINPTQNLAPVRIEILADDDHGVAEVRLVLTVTKGSGEGLKFQDQSEILPGRSLAGSTNLTYGRSLDLAALGLAPGDELYLQAVALDTRHPTPNESRSETRCVTLAGPSMKASEPAVVLSGLRRIPQYFRSQRQLILDTEQLLAERSSLSEAQFRTRSENLGIDQKLLRLRYGQFLGEEFEPASAGAPQEAVAQEWAATLRNPAGQDANRAAAIGRAIETTHAHEPDPAQKTRPRTAQEMFAGVAHNHDSAEAATLFDERLKTSLRSVLASMWEAEGHLRTAQPSAALPAEQRALEILKALQQADRLSVGQVGSETPPLRLEERRLRGELDAIPASTPGTAPSPRNDTDAVALRRVVTSLSGAASSQIPPDLAARVEDLLWRAAQAQPERYLSALETWRSRETGPQPSDPDIRLDTIRQAVWSLLPATEESPRRRRSTQPVLEERYADALAAPSSRLP